MSNLTVYVIGFVIFTAGLAFMAHLAGAPPVWILAGVVAFLGLGLIMAVTRTRRREPPPPDAV